MTINLRDQTTRIVTTDGRNEDPSWAPDSRHVVFTSTKSGTRQLWIVDTETGASRQLTFGPEARLAAWSPRLLSQ
jgi:TolB protein